MPLIVAVGCAVLGEWTDIDLAAARFVYDGNAHTFPLRHVLWLDVIMHHGAKYAVVAVALVMLARLVLSFAVPASAQQRRVLLFIVLSMSLAPLSVTLGKALSTTHCPWDVAEFGGFAPYSRLFTGAVAHIKPGRCFPAGHASTGFSLLAFYFSAYALRRHAAARAALLVGVTAGVVLGTGRVMQGAHFPTHVVWAGVLCWSVMVVLYGLCLAYPQRNDTAWNGVRR